MFLKPMGSGHIHAWPGEAVVPGGNAWVAFVDDRAVLGADGEARFEIRRRRREFGRPRAETVTRRQCVPVALRKGDVVALVLGGREEAWRYDPDGNLRPAARLLLRCARIGTVIAVLVAAAAAVGDAGEYANTLFYGGAGSGGLASELVRDNATRVYPRKAHEPSGYLRALIQARKANAEPRAVSEAWIKDHPLPQDAQGAAR